MKTIWKQAMIEFVTGRADILLATTIIESGLDIPNANTMFIHQADIYGLADHASAARTSRSRSPPSLLLSAAGRRAQSSPQSHATPESHRRIQ
jgi:RecG-like helicase